MSVFDTTQCTLGEGSLWHPGRNTLFWFDILGKTLFAKDDNGQRSWSFDSHHSAAGWVDENTLLIASETALWRFDIEAGTREYLIGLEAENAVTRSNDGRADPWGGFWIGTMGKAAEPQAGAIYRYYRGALRQLHPQITISNAICFAPDRSCAYFTDTVTQQVMRQPLRAEDGWPAGPAEVLIDLSATRLNPDGAVTDAAGNIWIAMWGASCVICYDSTGREVHDGIEHSHAAGRRWSWEA